MILLIHHGEDTTPVAVINEEDATQDHIDKVIVESFEDWCCPPEGNYELFRDPQYPTTVYIKYETGYIDHDGDGYFTTQNIPVK